jgi:hypothetical protein
MESRVPPRYIPFDASRIDLLPLQLDLLVFLYPLANSLKRELAPSASARVASIHEMPRRRVLGNLVSGVRNSRKLNL